MFDKVIVPVEEKFSVFLAPFQAVLIPVSVPVCSVEKLSFSWR